MGVLLDLGATGTLESTLNLHILTFKYIWNTYFFYSILGIRLYIHGVCRKGTSLQAAQSDAIAQPQS